MTVYVVHELSPKLDVSSAAVYGDLQFVNARYIFVDELVKDKPPQGFEDNLRRAASNFIPKKDYLLIAGDHLQLVMMASLLTEMHPGFYVLRYEREAQGYVPIMIGDIE